MIRIWNTFSPNNSTSCRLIARFADPRAAREVAAEVAAYLVELISEVREEWSATEAVVSTGSSSTCCTES